MAEKKKTVLLLDQGKIDTLNKLKEQGYDTANKIKTLDGRKMIKLGLKSEMENIYDLQDSIKANHGELGWLMDGEDPKPARKETVQNEQDDSRTGNSGEEKYNY